MTFLWVASSTSKGGTIWPPGKASILMRPPVTTSSRLPKACIWSKAAPEAGQLVWIFSVFCACGWADAGCAWAYAGNDIVADTANAASPDRNLFIVLPPSSSAFLHFLRKPRVRCSGEPRLCWTPLGQPTNRVADRDTNQPAAAFYPGSRATESDTVITTAIVLADEPDELMNQAWRMTTFARTSASGKTSKQPKVFRRVELG